MKEKYVHIPVYGAGIWLQYIAIENNELYAHVSISNGFCELNCV